MKKYLIASVLAISLVTPTVSFAQTATSTTPNAALIQELQAILASLVAELQHLLAQQGISSPSSQAVTLNFSTYTQLTASSYTKNPPQYLNQGIEISPLAITDFLPAGGSGGTHNYLHAGGNTDTSQDIMLEIDNPNDYQSIISKINKNDYIVVYGLGQTSQAFSVSNLFGTHTTYYATLSVQRIDKCQSYQCSLGQTTTIFGSATPTSNTTPPVTTTNNISTVSTVSSTTQAPVCTLTASPTSIQSGQQSKLTWTSTNATAGSISNVGQLTTLNNAMWVSPTVSTVYTGTFINGSGKTTTCTATVTFVPPTMTNGKYDQTISFAPLQNVTSGIVGFTIDAQASSGLGVNFTSQGSCSISNAGNTVATGLGTGSVLINGVGSCTITAHQAGNASYNPAPDVSQTFSIASSASGQ